MAPQAPQQAVEAELIALPEEVAAAAARVVPPGVAAVEAELVSQPEVAAAVERVSPPEAAGELAALQEVAAEVERVLRREAAVELRPAFAVLSFSFLLLPFSSALRSWAARPPARATDWMSSRVRLSRPLNLDGRSRLGLLELQPDRKEPCSP